MFQITICPVFLFQSVMFCVRCVFSHLLSATYRRLLVKPSLIPLPLSEAWRIFKYVCMMLIQFVELPIALILEHNNRSCSTAWSFFSGNCASGHDGQPRVVQGSSDVDAAWCSSSVPTFQVILLPQSSG